MATIAPIPAVMLGSLLAFESSLLIIFTLASGTKRGPDGYNLASQSARASSVSTSSVGSGEKSEHQRATESTSALTSIFWSLFLFTVASAGLGFGVQFGYDGDMTASLLFIYAIMGLLFLFGIIITLSMTKGGWRVLFCCCSRNQTESGESVTSSKPTDVIRYEIYLNIVNSSIAYILLQGIMLFVYIEDGVHVDTDVATFWIPNAGYVRSANQALFAIDFHWFIKMILAGGLIFGLFGALGGVLTSHMNNVFEFLVYVYYSALSIVSLLIIMMYFYINTYLGEGPDATLKWVNGWRLGMLGFPAVAYMLFYLFAHCNSATGLKAFMDNGAGKYLREQLPSRLPGRG